MLNLPNQSNPNPIQSVIERGNPWRWNVFFVEKGKTSHSQEIDDQRLHKKLGSSDRTGKPVELSEDIRVKHAHDGTGEPVKSNASTHTVEEFVPAGHRDTASSNANDKFNLATDEENIDFNISGVPNAMVKRSHGINVHNLIQKIENHPQRQALQSDLQQHRAFNPFIKESQDAIKAAGNTELCEIVDVEPKAQCRYMVQTNMLELGRTEEVIREMDRLASEDHSQIATEEEIDVYRGNWWIRSNLVDFDTIPTRHRPDFKKALSTLHRLKKAQDKAHYENSSHSSSSWWQWQTTWLHPYYETSPH